MTVRECIDYMLGIAGNNNRGSYDVIIVTDSAMSNYESSSVDVSDIVIDDFRKEIEMHI